MDGVLEIVVSTGGGRLLPTYLYMYGLDAQQNLDEMVVLFGGLFLLMLCLGRGGGGRHGMSVQVMPTYLGR